MEDAVGSRSTFVEAGVRVTTAQLSGLFVTALDFPASHTHRVDPERGYAGVVVRGALEKTFARDTRLLSAGSAFTMPPGASHATQVAPRPTSVVVLHPNPAGASTVPWPELLREFSAANGAALGPAVRLGAELHAKDEAWSLAAEGLCLELVAAFLRAARPARARSRPSWLDGVRERLHDGHARIPSLTELAEAAGVHPVHLARTFRAHNGVSVGDYARRLRLDWVAGELTTTEVPIAAVAADAGFADQSHFTRAFKRHTGLTPARYRAARR